MNELQLSTRQKVIALVLFIFSIVAVLYPTRPAAYTGYIVALVLIFLIGMQTNKKIGTLAGVFSISIGFILRYYIPLEVSESMIEATEKYNAFLSKFFWLLIIGGLVIGLLAGAIGEILAEDRLKPITTKRLTMMAILVALSVIINTLRIGSVSFGGFPIIYAGYFLGPINGFIVGAVADILGFIVRPSSFAFNPLFTLTSALTGLIPVIVTRLLGEEYPKLSFVKVLIGVYVGQFITSVFLAPLFQMILFGQGFWVLVGRAAIKQALSGPLYAFLVVAISNSVSKVIKLDSVKSQ
ncbi:MAG: folate family ECF transporter S component [Clostridiaceae bacterium]|nr:folate family ECF transporter S component [Clostridiaceae bacterium]